MKIALAVCLLIAACKGKPSGEPAPTASAPVEAPAPPTGDATAGTQEMALARRAVILEAAIAERAGAPLDAGLAEALPDASAAKRADSHANAQAAELADLMMADPTTFAPDEVDMKKRRPGTDLDEQLAAAKELGASVAVGGHGGGKGTRDAVAAPKGPRGRVSITDVKADAAGRPSLDAMSAKIQGVYMPGLERCYKARLGADPSARGRVVIALTVTETGATKAPRVTAFDATLDDCIAGMTTGWRFPIPKDDAGAVTETGFTITLHLVPD